MIFRHMPALALLLLTSLMSAPASAETEAPTPNAQAEEEAMARRVQDLSDELLSPFCPGKTVTNCTSYQAYKLRGRMRAMAKRGMSDDEIITRLRADFDTEELQIANPEQPWYTFFVPILPFFLGGLLIVWIFLRWRGGRPQGEAATPSAPDAEKLARLRAMAAEDED